MLSKEAALSHDYLVSHLEAPAIVWVLSSSSSSRFAGRSELSYLCHFVVVVFFKKKQGINVWSK